MNNQKTTLTIVAMVAAMGLLGALAVQSIVLSQEAHATIVILKHHGCAFFSQGFKSSHGKCFHPG